MASSGQINRIAYINPQGQLATISPDGLDPYLLTLPHRTFQFPAWSPDGAYLAAIGSDRVGSGIFVTPDRSEAGEPDILYYSASHFPIYFYWAPDSWRISFITGRPQEGIGLYLVSVADKHSRLIATGQPLFWSWLPDGNQIFIHTGLNSPEARLALVDLDQNSLSDNIAQPGIFQTPGISASGRFWAFAEIDTFDNGQLVIKDRINQEQMTIPHEGALALSWSPGGDYLAFISPPYPVQRFYGPLTLVEPNRKSVQPLVEEMVLAFFWSPDGRQIAYLTLVTPPGRAILSSPPIAGRNNGVYRSDRTGAQDDSPQTPVNLYLDLWVMDIAAGHRRKLATFEPAALFLNQFLPFFDQYALSHRLWSPASDALVLPVMEGNTAQIIVVFTRGGPPQSIAEGSMAFWSCQ